MKKDFPKAKANLMEGKKVDPFDVENGPPKKNRFYAFQSKGDQE